MYPSDGQPSPSRTLAAHSAHPTLFQCFKHVVFQQSQCCYKCTLCTFSFYHFAGYYGHLSAVSKWLIRALTCTVDVEPNTMMSISIDTFFVKPPMKDTSMRLDLFLLEFRIYVTYSVASPQKDISKLDVNTILCIIFIIVWCIRSALPLQAWFCLHSPDVRCLSPCKRRPEPYIHHLCPCAVRESCNRSLIQSSRGSAWTWRQRHPWIRPN